MLSAIIWWAGIFLGSLILIRGFQGKFLSKYPFFFAYSACVVAVWLPGYFVYLHTRYSAFYGTWYWCGQFLTLVVGYGILLEIFRHVLAPYPGAEKFARTTGHIVFVAIFGFALIFPLVMPQVSPGTTIEFERDLRSVQAIFVCGLLLVIAYYGISLGRNMKGMIFGYGLYVGTSLVSLAVRSYAGTSFGEIWKVVQPLSYDASLVVWAVALWSYCPNPVPDRTISLEADYEVFVSTTRRAIGTMRGHLAKAARQ
jgi:hypothetical protein